MAITYVDAGVDQTKKDKAVDEILRRMKRTHGKGVIDLPWGFAGLHAIKCIFHRSTPATLHAHDIVHGAMHFNDTIRGIAGALVKSIDVLGHERVQLAAPL